LWFSFQNKNFLLIFLCVDKQKKKLMGVSESKNVSEVGGKIITDIINTYKTDCAGDQVCKNTIELGGNESCQQSGTLNVGTIKQGCEQTMNLNCVVDNIAKSDITSKIKSVAEQEAKAIQEGYSGSVNIAENEQKIQNDIINTVQNVFKQELSSSNQIENTFRTVGLCGDKINIDAISQSGIQKTAVALVAKNQATNKLQSFLDQESKQTADAQGKGLDFGKLTILVVVLVVLVLASVIGFVVVKRSLEKSAANKATEVAISQ
jgi:hypothetical protein